MFQKLDQYLKRPLGLILIVAYKGIWGLMEIILGALAIIFGTFIRHVATSDFVHGLIAREIAEDPQDIFINWLVSHARWLDATLSVGWILIILGAIKVAIALGIWFRSWAVRDFGIVFFSGVAIYGVYELTVDFSFFKLLAVLLDTFILFYFWQMLPKHLGPRRKE